jgi:outer membrane protein OmpA-like peptidoglycan-associated protein
MAQSVAGRIAFGFDAGGNKYYGNFTDNQFAIQGDAFIRWNIFDWLSLHAAYNAGQLKYKAQPNLALTPPIGGTLGTINHTRVGGWDLMLSYNVFPDQTFVPYFIAGIEALNFEPKDANDISLPNNANAVYNKNVIGGVAGVGFEMYISDKVTFNGKVLLHMTGTDWIDDYSDPLNSRQDAYLNFGVGFSYYIFAPDIVHHMDAGSTTTNVTNIYPSTTVVHVDTVVVREVDTVYKTRVVKGTIYNFPGELFIVNTDQFNTAVPGNLQNLQNIKRLVNQCPDLRVEIQGHASHEGTVQRNQELSELRATKIKNWLIEQGVNPSKIAGTIGLGTSDDAVHEPTNSTPAQLEAARILNRRMSIKVVEGCN